MSRITLHLNVIYAVWIFTLNHIIALCPSGFTPYSSYCYGIDPHSIKNWNESEARCQGLGGHLASIHSQDELIFIQRFIRQQRILSSIFLSDALWVGLHNPLPLTISGQARFAYRQGWQWSDSSTYSDRNPWYDSLWASDAPIEYQDCAVIGLSEDKLVGKRKDLETNHGVCKVRAKCPTAFHQFGTNCYMIDKDKEVTRRLYLTYCASMGGHLVSIASGAEFRFLEKTIRDIFPSSYIRESFWIGLWNELPVQNGNGPSSSRRYGWEWSDGLPYNTSLNVLWDLMEPGAGEKYTYMSNFIWYGTRDSESRRKGICKINVAKVAVLVPTTTTTSTTIVTTPTPTSTTTTLKTTTTTTASTTSTTTTTTPKPTRVTTTTTPKPTRVTTPMPTRITKLTPAPRPITTTETTLQTSSESPVQFRTVATILPTVFVRIPQTSFIPLPTTTTETNPPLPTTTVTDPPLPMKTIVTSPPQSKLSSPERGIYPTIYTTQSGKPGSKDNNNNVVNDDGSEKNWNITKPVRAGPSTGKKLSNYAPAFVAAPVFILFIIIIIILVRKGFICSGGSGRTSGRRRQRINSTPQTDTVVQVDNLGYYLSYPGLSVVEKEYKAIPGTFEHPSHIGRWQPSKNTFKNYIPYDDNRVTLEQKDEDPNSDYINASFIQGYTSAHKTYIAAQGPRENTVVDFWRMIWEHGVSVIIMLTSPAESGKGKCLVYWPVKEGDSTKYGEIKVVLDRQFVYADDTVRIFFIKKGSQSRRVTQFYFHAWPDSGAPTYPVTLINFRRKVKKEAMSVTSPVLIHCSSGVGRTGTFIAIDYLLEQAATERVVDVYNCVTKLRQQRPWMVTTLREYKCVYHAVHEGVTTGSTTIPRDQFYNTFRLLTTHQPEAGGATSLQQQFKTIRNIEAELKLLGKIDTIRAMMRGIGKSSKKTRKEPEIFHRLDGFKKPNAFILTSAPLVTKIDEFWNTVYERKCKVIVMLCPRENISFIQTYFPDEEEATFSSPPNTIECLSVREDGSQFPVIAKEMKIETRGRARHNFCHMSVKSDLARLPVPSQAAILVYLRNLSRQRSHDSKTNTRFPVLVHCLNGSDWSGVFYALCYILEQLDMENEVDIFQAVRQVRHLHPHLIQTEEQYMLLYEAVAYYIQRNQPDYYTC